jgi:glycerol kinase
MEKSYILAFDQGTTSCRSLLFNTNFELLGISQQEIRQTYPNDGWVEQDAEEIYHTQMQTARDIIEKLDVDVKAIEAIGITNQRESFVVWDKQTGKPVHPCIVWQDKRTANVCERMGQEEISRIIRRKTGLLTDPYFSGTKFRWLLDHHPEIREGGRHGKYLFGTIDSWLIWKMSNGKHHITDVSNASRTLLFNIHALKWDDELLDYFDVPKAMMPKVTDSSGQLAKTEPALFSGTSIPITGIAGDQQAALFGQACYTPGMVKNTYGTGCFMLMNVGNHCPPTREDGLLRTVAWRIGGEPAYALEGSIFFAGATIKWLRDKLELIDSAGESESLARSIDNTSGVYFVPAFAGLGTPYWDPDARGIIIGLTQAAGKAELIRAGLESLAYQTRDVLEIMQDSAGMETESLRVDGGASANDFLLQFQADITNQSVSRPDMTETTALGAAFLAAIGAGMLSLDDMKQYWRAGKRFEPDMAEDKRKKLYNGWKRAVERSRDWYQES